MESTSLTKALGLLEATAGHPAGRSLADLAAEVGMPKPNVHRILKSLTALGCAIEIEKASRQGYATEESETDLGVSCIGAPVCAGDEVVGAVSVSLPTARFDAAGRRRLVALVQKTARTISTRLTASSSRSSPRKESR